eukprot:COSAG01_NODE_7402_length_3221_cov_1.491672_2_plen_126_part_00
MRLLLEYDPTPPEPWPEETRAEVCRLILQARHQESVERTLKPLMWNSRLEQGGLLELSLAGNGLSDEVCAVLAECLCGNDKLQHLDLGGNLLTAHATTSVAQLYHLRVISIPTGIPDLAEIPLCF